jgi:hypothetical protein
MSGAIFLSASVPDPRRAPEYAKTADSVAIGSAVAALLHVVLGRRLLIWGGHPAITPMIWALAEGMGLEYGNWVQLYQSDYFKDEFPEDNEKYRNTIVTPKVEDNREASLRVMRETMFAKHQFDGAVFIGGMKGIIDEFELFKAFHPHETVVPLLSTGGATLELGKHVKSHVDDLQSDLDYVAVLHRHLSIDVRELRYHHPNEQPAVVEDRLWTRGDRDTMKPSP